MNSPVLVPWDERLILPHDDGTWSPSEGDGIRAAIVQIYHPDPPCELVDAVAWSLVDPRRWWLRCGLVTLLGETALRKCWWENQPVTLLPTPEDWVLYQGPDPIVVILRWDADLRSIFWRVPEVRCATAALATLLRRRLAEQVAPSFRISVA
jgi:hypothetical protein